MPTNGSLDKAEFCTYLCWQCMEIGILCRGNDLRKNLSLDPLDLRILAELQADNSLSNVALARRVHLSPSPGLMRVKALEAAGVIQRYVASADAAALGLGLNVFINISLKEQSKASLAIFEQRIAEHDEVMMLPDDWRLRLSHSVAVKGMGELSGHL